MNGSERFENYRMFCNKLNCPPKYLCINVNKHLKYALNKFRFGVSDLPTHHYRYRHHGDNDLICRLFNSANSLFAVHFII